jgi:hypothetical protein
MQMVIDYKIVKEEKQTATGAAFDFYQPNKQRW